MIHVVKYDLKSFEQGKDYSDLSVSAPEIVGSFESMSDARDAMTRFRAEGLGEDIDITMANGRHYTGHRFLFDIAEDMT